MSTGTELTTMVRNQTLLDTGDVSDAIILDHLNRAIKITGGRFAWPFLHDDAVITTVVGTQAYAFPTGAVFIDAIIEPDERIRLREIGRMDAWDRYGDDPPTRDARSFYLWEEKVVFTEIPQSIIAYIVKIRVQPTLLASGAESPQWNAQYHDFLSEYAIAKLWEREEDRALAADAMERFHTGVGDMAAFYMNQVSDTPMVWGERPDRAYASAYANTPWIDGV